MVVGGEPYFCPPTFHIGGGGGCGPSHFLRLCGCFKAIRPSMYADITINATEEGVVTVIIITVITVIILLLL